MWCAVTFGCLTIDASARIKTTDAETKILATVDDRTRTIYESSIRQNLKLHDELGISSLPDAELFENLTLMGRARIAQSLTLPTIADEPASPFRDDSQGEACLTVSGLEVEQDRENIIKSSTLPYESTSRVISFAADEGSMQHQIQELMALCTSLQRQQTEMVSKLAAQELEITNLKVRIQLLKNKDGGGVALSREDTPIKRRSLEIREEAGIETSTDEGSNDTEEMVNVLTSLDAVSILTSGVQVSIPPAAKVAIVSIPLAGEIPTGSVVVPTASPIFTTASVVTPYTRRKGKEKIVESDTPKKKKLQEKIDVQVARELEEEMARDAQRMNEQIAKDAEIARIHLAKKATFQEAKEGILHIEDFVPMGSKEKAETVKRKGLRLEQESVKKLKTSEEVPKEMKSSEEVPEESSKEMMQLVPVEEVYLEALQVKHPILEEDLNQLWALVKESPSIRLTTNDKEKELWVELKRLYEPDVDDQL
nr:hypothetical protein [Tanacetum cinerariifolium]